jgi:hypothetical protein
MRSFLATGAPGAPGLSNGGIKPMGYDPDVNER